MFSVLHLDSTQADLDSVQEEVGFVHYIVHLYFVALFVMQLCSYHSLVH